MTKFYTDEQKRVRPITGAKRKPYRILEMKVMRVGGKVRRGDLAVGDFIRLKPNAIVINSVTGKEVPRKWVKDGGLWAIDAVFEDSLNINRVLEPYPGAFCSYVNISYVAEIALKRGGKRNKAEKKFEKVVDKSVKGLTTYSLVASGLSMAEKAAGAKT